MWLSGQALAAVLYFWPVTLALAVVVGVVAFKTAKQRRLAVRCIVGSAAPAVIPILIIAWGTAFERVDAGRAFGDPGWHSHAVTALLAVVVPLVGIAVWKAAGCRWLAVAIGAFIGWCSMWAAFVAGMSVTGDWI